MRATIEVRFEFYVEYLLEDEQQMSEHYLSLFDAVEAAVSLKKKTERQTQVRVALEVDEEGRYVEQYCPMLQNFPVAREKIRIIIVL